jgi:hypothetical protein
MDFLTTQGMTRKPGIEGGIVWLGKLATFLRGPEKPLKSPPASPFATGQFADGLSPEEATYMFARNMLIFRRAVHIAKAAW